MLLNLVYLGVGDLINQGNFSILICFKVILFNNRKDFTKPTIVESEWIISTSKVRGWHERIQIIIVMLICQNIVGWDYVAMKQIRIHALLARGVDWTAIAQVIRFQNSWEYIRPYHTSKGRQVYKQGWVGFISQSSSVI